MYKIVLQISINKYELSKTISFTRRLFLTGDGDENVEALQNVHLLKTPAADEVVHFPLTAAV